MRIIKVNQSKEGETTQGKNPEGRWLNFMGNLPSKVKMLTIVTAILITTLLKTYVSVLRGQIEVEILPKEGNDI